MVCRIGDNWFFFGGRDAEVTTAAEYQKEIPAEEIVRTIHNVLEELKAEFEDEYLYYEYYLREKIRDPDIVRNPEHHAQLQIADRFVLDDQTSVYSVSLAYGFFVDGELPLS